MKLLTTLLLTTIYHLSSISQSTPAIKAWLQNTVNTGAYYVAGNSAAIDNNIL